MISAPDAISATGFSKRPASLCSRDRHSAVRRRLTARLSYVDFDGAAAFAASEATPADSALPDDFLPQHCRRVLEGADRITRWLQEFSPVSP